MKLGNIYVRSVPAYDDIPKSVLAAIAFSLALRITGDNFEEARRVLITEWDTLNQPGNNIVPQAVPVKLRRFIGVSE